MAGEIYSFDLYETRDRRGRTADNGDLCTKDDQRKRENDGYDERIGGIHAVSGFGFRYEHNQSERRDIYAENNAEL